MNHVFTFTAVMTSIACCLFCTTMPAYSDDSVCAFYSTLIAAVPGELDSLKGREISDSTDESRYWESTLVAPGASSCTIYGGVRTAPEYTCTWKLSRFTTALELRLQANSTVRELAQCVRDSKNAKNALIFDIGDNDYPSLKLFFPSSDALYLFSTHSDDSEHSIRLNFGYHGNSADWQYYLGHLGEQDPWKRLK